MRHLDLFSGIGGFALAAERVWESNYENIGHSETDDAACKIYHRHYPGSRCLGDIERADWEGLELGPVDLLTAGFPCQPHSVAGKRNGSSDERDMGPALLGAIRRIRPRFALLENVPALFISDRGGYFNGLLSGLAACGYDAEWAIVSAGDVGAPHLRERLWTLAYPEGLPLRARLCSGLEETVRRGRSRNGGGPGIHTDALSDGLPEGRLYVRPRKSRKAEALAPGRGENAPDAQKPGLERPDSARNTRSGRRPPEYRQGGRASDWWSSEPDVGRVAHGVSGRVDRLRCLGNAIVPQVASALLEKIKEVSP